MLVNFINSPDMAFLSLSSRFSHPQLPLVSDGVENLERRQQTATIFTIQVFEMVHRGSCQPRPFHRCLPR
jgi:hypothetical protein